MRAQAEDVLFEEEQAFRQTWVWALLGATLLLLVVPLGFISCGAPVKAGSNTFSGVVGLALGIAVVIGVAVLMYSMRLTVRLDAEGLHVRFFPLVKRDIPLEQIARWESRTYRPILEYGGWGIRCGWKGMAYNVSGNRGVQLEFTNGKRLLIGLQRPEELAAAISQVKQHGD
jgi:hypothetical protein